MRILGIDPSLTGCGLAVVEDGKFVWSRVVSTPADQARGGRLVRIGHEVALEAKSWEPVTIAMEGYALAARFNREAMGEVGGVIKYALADRHGCEPAIWQPSSAWKLVLGSGKQAKDTIRLQVFQRYGVDLKTTHEVDAFVIAMAEYLAQTGAPRPRPKKRKAPEGE